jgi:Secretion system C-terminal sorting domain
MKSLFTLLVALLLTNFLFAQIVFQRTIGGNNNDLGNAVQQTSDGGYIIAGETISYGTGNRDVYLVKLDMLGDLNWSKTYGENAEDYGLALDRTSDNGYIIGAHTGSFGQGSHDYYLIKTDSNGDTLFTKLYGGTGPDGIYSLHETLDGGYILGGHTSSYGAGAHDFYLIKTNGIGDTEWTKTYGGSSPDYLRSVVSLVTPTPSYVVIGETSGFGIGGADILVVRVDGSSGDIVWAKTYGGSSNDYAFGIYQTADDGLIIVGHTSSFGAGGTDIYVIKTDLMGNIQWSKTYGGTGNEYGYAIQQTTDNGYIMVGCTTSFGAGSKDVYLIKTDVNGDTLWSKTYGGSMDEVGYSIQQTSDDGYVITGNTSSFGAGQKDIYIIKTDANGFSGECNEFAAETLVSNSATIETTPILTVDSGAISSSSATIVTNATPSNLSVCNILNNNALPGIENEILVIPNPFSESAVVKFNYDSGNYTFLLYSINGQLVLEIENINSNQITVEKNNLKEGLYFFQLRNDYQIIGSGKLIIE